MIGEELGLSDADLDKLHWSGLLHDVGKLFVPAEILNKPGRLTDEEFEVIKRPSRLGRRALRARCAAGWATGWTRSASTTSGGTGAATRTAWPARTSRWRPGSCRWPTCSTSSPAPARTSRPRSAVDGRRSSPRCAGTQFDAEIVRAFLSVGLGRLRLVMGPLSWLAQLPIIGRVPVGPALGAAASAAATALAVLTGSLLDEPDPAPPTQVVASSPAPAEGASQPMPEADPPVDAPAEVPPPPALPPDTPVPASEGPPLPGVAPFLPAPGPADGRRRRGGRGRGRHRDDHGAGERQRCRR